MKLGIIWLLEMKILAQRLCRTMYPNIPNISLGESGNYSSTTVVEVGIKDRVITSTIA